MSQQLPNITPPAAAAAAAYDKVTVKRVLRIFEDTPGSLFWLSSRFLRSTIKDVPMPAGAQIIYDYIFFLRQCRQANGVIPSSKMRDLSNIHTEEICRDFIQGLELIFFAAVFREEFCREAGREAGGEMARQMAGGLNDLTALTGGGRSDRRIVGEMYEVSLAPANRLKRCRTQVNTKLGEALADISLTTDESVEKFLALRPKRELTLGNLREFHDHIA